mmetsp:Transcript_101184/g.315327  ORF Transcript_101184/g.315327 Transcript_101184/m.315327 type:complete len:236 (-) Transcript_101184:517-1224(-)
MCVGVFAPCCSNATVNISTTDSNGQALSGASPNSSSSSAFFTVALLSTSFSVPASPSFSPAARCLLASGSPPPSAPAPSSRPRFAPSPAGAAATSAAGSGSSFLASCFGGSVFRSQRQYFSTFFMSGSFMRMKPAIRVNSGFAWEGKELAARGSGGTHSWTASGSRCSRFWWKDSRCSRSNARRRKRCDCTGTESPVKGLQSAVYELCMRWYAKASANTSKHSSSRSDIFRKRSV